MCFNSRTPCGVRLSPDRISYKDTKFQFTHPVWGATCLGVVARLPLLVSIHAPRVGCDVC